MFVILHLTCLLYLVRNKKNQITIESLLKSGIDQSVFRDSKFQHKEGTPNEVPPLNTRLGASRSTKR